MDLAGCCGHIETDNSDTQQNTVEFWATLYWVKIVHFVIFKVNARDLGLIQQTYLSQKTTVYKRGILLVFNLKNPQ